MIATATLPVDRWSHGGEDPDPAEIHMPKWAPNLDLPLEGLITMAEGPAVRQMHPLARKGDELIATISPQLDVVLDESGCIVLNTNGSTRLTISDAGELGRALLEARLVAEAREQGYDRRHPCGHPLCISCDRPAGVPHAEGTIGGRTGPLCKDCAHYCDGNVVTSPASCGHPRNEDGECDCSTWPEPNPHAHDGHVSCTPEGCVVR